MTGSHEARGSIPLSSTNWKQNPPINRIWLMGGFSFLADRLEPRKDNIAKGMRKIS